MYSEQKAAQMCAFFLSKVKDGTMAHLKLIKLLYLADRESYKRYGYSISQDKTVSMPHGPVLSQTLNYLNGEIQPTPGGWEDWIADQTDHRVKLKKENVTRLDLKEMSDSDIAIMEKVWGEFQHMDEWEISDYTHKHCGEWEDPHGSSLPIACEKILQAVGYSEKDAKKIAEKRREEEAIDLALGRPA